jgi:hypothetical protein
VIRSQPANHQAGSFSTTPDSSIAEDDKAAIEAFAASEAGISMPMVPQYSQLLDVLGIMQSGVMSKSITIDAALKDGQSRAEAIMKA